MKQTFKMEKVDGRYYFHDGKKYSLIDTGLKSVASADGTIGDFKVDMLDAAWYKRFNPTVMPDGSNVAGTLCPTMGYSCLMRGDGTVTIDNGATELPEHDWFLPYVRNNANPFATYIECAIDGKKKLLLFDSGMRMAVSDDKSLIEGKQKLGEINERIGWMYLSATAPYYEATFEFPCGFKFDGHIEYDYSGFLVKKFFGEERDDHDKGFLGIEFFDKYDVFLSGIEGKKGMALIKRK
jgi:hypothetical protein